MPIITTDRLLDMNSFGRDELADLAQTGQLVSATPTRVEIRGYSDLGYEFRVIFTGTELGGLSPTGFPTTGLITGFRLEQGGDLVFGIDGLSVQASALNATLTTNDSTALWNLLYGGADTITGGDTWGRANTLFGHGGNDTLNGGTGGDWLNGGAGDDIVYGGDETDPTSTTYGDGIDGAEGNDTLYGGAGRDVIVGGDGGDVIDGGDGNDILYHDGDGLTATDGFMTLQDGFGNSYTVPVRGFLAGDRRAEDGAADTVNGGAGDDFIYLGVGDSADGGAGGDTVEVNFRGRNSALTLDMSTGSAAAVTAVSGGTFVNVERFDVVGTLFNDVITGGAEGSILYGEAGEDRVDGGGGNDSVAGSAFTNSSRINNVWGSRFDDGQRDTLFGGEGNDGVSVGLLDTADGGAGTDSLLVTLDGMTQGVNLDLTTGDRFATIATVTGGTYVNFETISALHTTEHDDVIRSLGVTSIYTFSGNDAVYADDITNTIGLGDGDDLAYGMGGNDLILGGFGNDRMYGGAGSDTIYADVDYDPTQAVGSGADFLDGGEGVDSLYGGAGDDVIVGGVGGDRIFGEAGTDTVSYQGSVAGISIQAILTGYEQNYDPIYNYFVSGGDAQGDTLTSIERVLGSEANDTITNFQYADGAGGADSIEGSGGTDVLLGGAGDDILRGLEGADTLNGGGGMDITEYSRFSGGGAGSSVTVDLRIQGVAQNTGGAGSDTLISIEGVVGTSKADVLHGDDQANYIQGAGDGIQPGSGPFQGDQLFGHGGDDIIIGDGAATGLGYTPGDGVSRGYDLISGGDGNDTITAGNGADVVNGDAGDDIIYGEWDSDTLNGGSGDDIIDGGTLNDRIDGGDDDDRLIGGSGNDALIGGAGIDTADYSSAAAGVTAQLNTGMSSNDGDGGSDTLSGIENLTGSAFNDVLIGDDASNVLRGGAGYDVLVGLAGNDVFQGGTGVANEMYGGLGDDLYVVEADGDTIVEQAGEGTDLVQANVARFRLASNVENLTYVGTGSFEGQGNDGGNLLRGGAQRDVFLGFGGDDILYAGSGAANELYGGTGNDYYIVEANDTIVEGADAGSDSIEARVNVYNLGANVENLFFGGTGDFIGTGNALNNLIVGGTGNDVLRGGGGSDQIQGGAGTDRLVLLGVQSDYTITAEGSGWRIVDLTQGRDGSILTTSIEIVEFGDKSTLTLGPPAGAEAGATFDADDAQVLPGLFDDGGSAKDGHDQPLVQPGLLDDGFLDIKPDTDSLGPQIQPGVFDDLGGLEFGGSGFEAAHGGGEAFNTWGGFDMFDLDLRRAIDEHGTRLDHMRGTAVVSDPWG